MTEKVARANFAQRFKSMRSRKPDLSAVSSLPAERLSHTPIGTRSLISAGTGYPTVVFEAGLGHGKEVWASAFNAISAETHAVAYDRAGYGGSER